MMSVQYCTHPYPGSLGQMVFSYCIMDNVYNDKLFAATVPRRCNKCAQIFATTSGWSCSFPMKLKTEAHKKLFLLFHWDRVLPAIICYNTKKMILNEFNRKLKDSSCHLRQTEQFTLWSKAAEREIKELKKSYGRKLIKSFAPKRL